MPETTVKPKCAVTPVETAPATNPGNSPMPPATTPGKISNGPNRE